VHREQGHRLYAAGRPFLRRLMRHVTYRIAVSEPARRTVAEHFPGSYRIVPNGIDVDGFAAPRERPSAFALGVPHVLYVGRLEPRKGLEHLIRAMPRVSDRAPSARLVVVGDGPERARLESLARTLGADVRFAGRVGDDELPAYVQACDVLCSPATGGESFGIVLLEAMACRTPVVASRIDGYARLMGEDDCALLVAPEDADALAAALGDLLSDEAARRRIGARAYARARQFDWPAIAGELESIYYNLLGR
jgi:phosphatidylinositol alpha-mannosyltransferase